MKITVKTVHTTTIDGSISEADLKAYVRERLKLPESTDVEIFGLDYETELGFKVAVREEDAAAPEPVPEQRCTAGDCQFPSLAGGLCASHMSEAHRRRHATLPSR